MIANLNKNCTCRPTLLKKFLNIFSVFILHFITCLFFYQLLLRMHNHHQYTESRNEIDYYLYSIKYRPISSLIQCSFYHPKPYAPLSTPIYVHTHYTPRDENRLRKIRYLFDPQAISKLGFRLNMIIKYAKICRCMIKSHP